MMSQIQPYDKVENTLCNLENRIFLIISEDTNVYMNDLAKLLHCCRNKRRNGLKLQSINMLSIKQQNDFVKYTYKNNLRTK